MSRILLAWELGAGQGHVRPLLSLARQLQVAGHDVLFAARDLLRVHAAIGDPATAPCQVLAAPAFPGLQTIVNVPLAALSDVLWYESGGYASEALRAHFHAWRTLIVGLRIDLLVSDAAPLALAAAAGVCPRLCYGGFFHQTDAAGWRIFRDWERIDRAAVESRAAQLLERLNLARRECALPAAASLAAACAAEQHVQRGLAALDPYGVRPGVHYLGAAPDLPSAHWTWPPESMSRARLLAYLRAGHPQQTRVLGALARFAEHGAVLCCYEGLPVSARPRVPHLYFVDAPVALAPLLDGLQAVFCHGGSLVHRVVQAGKPVMVLPTHTEQFLVGRQLQARGAGVLAQPLERPDVLAGLREVVTDPRHSQAAAQIALVHAQGQPAGASAEVILEQTVASLLR